MMLSLLHFVSLYLSFGHALPASGSANSNLSGIGLHLQPRTTALATRLSYTAISNGQIWYDTEGNAIQAFGGGFLKVRSSHFLGLPGLQCHHGPAV